MDLKSPLCLKGPGWRLGGTKGHVAPPLGRLVGAMARLAPLASASVDIKSLQMHTTTYLAAMESMECVNHNKS